VNYGAMLNVYPDSIGGNLRGLSRFLSLPKTEKAFTSCYLLPSLFRSDLDRGFSLISYELDEKLADEITLSHIRDSGIELTLDFLVNHISVQSPEFQDVLKNGKDSPYRDFFVDWNRFWEGYGTMTEAGYLQPEASLLNQMFFRKPGLPLLSVEFPDGRLVPYWNTFYQQVNPQNPRETRYLGQMDLNVCSPLVWEYYEKTLRQLAEYGAKLIRLDAFAYAHKAPGRRNFLNEPETWDLLQRLKTLAEPLGLTLLPEIHAAYEEQVYRKLHSKGYPVYDFFLPGLILDAFRRENGEYLCRWGKELQEDHIYAVNMLGCHDGIPLLDLRGLLPETDIQELIQLTVSRGGYVKDLHGAKNTYYQVNATYFSALGEDEQRLLAARAIQLFMPGKPQIWYLDLFAGKNDYAAMEKAGPGGHKELNRTNLTTKQVEDGLSRYVVEEQLRLLRFRNTCPVFTEDAEVKLQAEGSVLYITWRNPWGTACLTADLKTAKYHLESQKEMRE